MIHKTPLIRNTPSAAAQGAAAVRAAAVSGVGEWLSPGTHPVPTTGTETQTVRVQKPGDTFVQGLQFPEQHQSISKARKSGHLLQKHPQRLMAGYICGNKTDLLSILF